MPELKGEIKVAMEQEESQGKGGKGKVKAHKSNAVTALEAQLTVAESNVIKGFPKPENIAKLQVCIQKRIIIITYVLLLILCSLL